jgi:phospholipid/cholesterol/gamma-HCH transport system substrate-binding protein
MAVLRMTTSNSGRWFQTAAVVAVLAVVASVVVAYSLGATSRTVTAYFSSAEGLFESNAVRVLGVSVGTITDIEPDGTRVRVEMEITDDDLKLPADVRAVVVSPSVVTGRYVQFTPTYSGGPELADGAVVPIEHTAVPLGVDDLTRTASELATALGPQGVNSTGALSDAIDVGARNLDGNGDAFNQSVRNLGELAGTLSQSREELFGTVTELQTFASTIAARDADVREFNQRLEAVAGFLAEDREDLGDAFRELSIALGDVAEFVRDNREILGSNVDRLNKVTDAVVRQRKALKEILDVAPTGLTNLNNGYNSTPGTLDTRINMPLPDMLGLLCKAAAKAYSGPPMPTVPFGDTPIGVICRELGLAASTGTDPVTALRALTPEQLGLPAGYQFPRLAVPTDQWDAIPDLTTPPDVPEPTSAVPAEPAPVDPAPADAAPAEPAPPAPEEPRLLGPAVPIIPAGPDSAEGGR